VSRELFNEDWSVRPKASIFFELGGKTEPFRTVTLPHDSTISEPRSERADGNHVAHYPSGVYQYLKRYTAPQSLRGKRIALEFEGAYRDAMVFVNDDYVGQRPNGYTGFTLDITPFLREGEVNDLRVEVRTHDDSRWYAGAGLYRDVWLHVTDELRVIHDGIRITTPSVEDDLAVVQVDAEVANGSGATRTARLVIELRDPDGRVVTSARPLATLIPGETASVSHRLFVNAPSRWRPDLPALYTAALTLEESGEELQRQEVRFGIRTLTLDPRHGLRINGESVKLRGACIHHDNGPLGAATIARAEERRVQLLKAAGFNAIRSSHNPMSRAMLDACDRHGMLVLDETFDVWTESKNSFDYSLHFPEWWERDVEAMVRKDFNHPSVIMYSIGNEIPETGSPLGSRYGRLLAGKVRELDTTRFVVNSINGMVAVIHDIAGMVKQGKSDGAAGVNAVMNSLSEIMRDISSSELVTTRTEESFDAVDIAGLNYGEARYEADRERFPDRILLGTETSPLQIAHNWALVESIPALLGDFTWTGWDYLGEVGLGRPAYTDDTHPPMSGPYPWRVAWSGDIDITGHRRPLSFYRETVFGLRHEPYIAVQDPANHGRQLIPGKWASPDALASWDWPVEDGHPVLVDVFSDADEVELLINGESIARVPAGQASSFRSTFDTAYRRGTIEAVAYVAGAEVARTVLATPTDAQLTLRADRNLIAADTADLSFIDLAMRDAQGVLVTTETSPVRVAVDGPGILQAFGTANPCTEESFVTDECLLYRGRALAIVRPTGVGTITVTAFSPHGEARIDIEARRA
jgi:beta-galactosidase